MQLNLTQQQLEKVIMESAIRLARNPKMLNEVMNQGSGYAPMANQQPAQQQGQGSMFGSPYLSSMFPSTQLETNQQPAQQQTQPVQNAQGNQQLNQNIGLYIKTLNNRLYTIERIIGQLSRMK